MFSTNQASHRAGLIFLRELSSLHRRGTAAILERIFADSFSP
jgi:hypothetical protein